jgi:hypothetical protein
MATRRLTAQQQRDRRTRILAVVLGCVFLLVCSIQVPRVLHQLHPAHAAAAVETGGSAASAETSLLSATGPPAPQVSRLSRFAYKNPFPEVATTTATPAKSPPAPTTTAAEPTTTAPAAATSPAPPPAPTVTVPFAPSPTRPGVLLVLAGSRRALGRGDVFPQAEPLFRVVGFTAKRVQLRLLTGTLAGGEALLTLPLRHRVVLRNTSDGTSLALEYLRPAKLALRAAAAKPAR